MRTVERHPRHETPGSVRPRVADRLCYCRGVSVAEFREAVVLGCRDFEVLLGRTGAGSGCGSCIGDARRLFVKAVDEARARSRGQLLLPFAAEL